MTMKWLSDNPCIQCWAGKLRLNPRSRALPRGNFVISTKDGLKLSCATRDHMVVRPTALSQAQGPANSSHFTGAAGPWKQEHRLPADVAASRIGKAFRARASTVCAGRKQHSKMVFKFTRYFLFRQLSDPPKTTIMTMT